MKRNLEKIESSIEESKTKRKKLEDQEIIEENKEEIKIKNESKDEIENLIQEEIEEKLNEKIKQEIKEEKSYEEIKELEEEIKEEKLDHEIKEELNEEIKEEIKEDSWKNNPEKAKIDYCESSIHNIPFVSIVYSYNPNQIYLCKNCINEFKKLNKNQLKYIKNNIIKK